jgi:hypothetical protein
MGKQKRDRHRTEKKRKRAHNKEHIKKRKAILEAQEENGGLTRGTIQEIPGWRRKDV